MQKPIDYQKHVLDLLKMVEELGGVMAFMVDLIDTKKLNPAKADEINRVLSASMKTLSDLHVRIARI